MTRILVVQNLYPPHSYGGYEHSCHDVVERWRRAGHEVTVLTSDHRVAGVPDAPEHDVWRRLPAALGQGGVLAAPPVGARLARERASRKLLAEAIATVQPDVVSLWHMAGLSSALLSDLVGGEVPLVYVICDDWLTYAQRVDPWLRMFATRPRLGRLVAGATGVPTTPVALGSTGTFCFASETTRQRAIDHTGWAFPSSVITFLGVDTADFPVASGPRSAPWRGRLLYVGRLDGRKGVDTAVAAMAHLPAATLELAGPADPATESRLLARVHELGVADRVSFAGAVPRSALRARYVGADAVLFPTEWEEPFGIVPLEAMACATPVIATGTGGSGEFLVDGYNCRQFPPGDAAALAAAVERLASDAALRARLVDGGLRTAATLTVDALAEALERVHTSVAKASRQPR
ncbi:MAG: glycosyltransferase family 4 protein [Actinobacteria bacterium]|nr:glycosyltransferase family 4 protein [Actinomycetota bacterium]